MEARIRTLEAILRDAVIVEAEGSTVGVGSVVEIRFQGDDETEKYLVGHIEERHDKLEVVSPGSPLGASLMGKAAGDKTDYAVNGTTITVEIVSVATS
jgi:transcription elongation factor GreA